MSPTATYVPFKYATLFKLVLSIDTVPVVNPVVVQTIPSSLIRIGVAVFCELITYFVPEYNISVNANGWFAILLNAHVVPLVLVITSEYVGVLEVAIYAVPFHNILVVSTSVGLNGWSCKSVSNVYSSSGANALPKYVLFGYVIPSTNCVRSKPGMLTVG